MWNWVNSEKIIRFAEVKIILNGFMLLINYISIGRLEILHGWLIKQTKKKLWHKQYFISQQQYI